MSNKKKAEDRLVRTSVQLPPEVLESLAKRWPGLTLSQQIRLALERHEYMMGKGPELLATQLLRDENLEAIAGALQDFSYRDFLLGCRAMPALVDEHMRDAGGYDREQLELVRQRIDEARGSERLHVFDAAVTRNLTQINSDQS